MKHLIFFLFIVLGVNAQDGYKTIKPEKDGLTFLQRNQPDSILSVYKYYVRYNNGHQTLDLYSNDSINFSARVTSYALQTRHKKKECEIYIYQTTEICTDTCKLITDEIFGKKLYDIPDAKDLKNYNINISDCSSVLLYYKINNNQITRTYDCPDFQFSDAAEIQKLFNTFTSLDSLMIPSYQRLLEVLPKQSWYEYFPGFYIPSEQQKIDIAHFNKIRAYLNEKKGTIRKIIKEVLDKTTHQYIQGNYTFSFSKKGKLKKIRPEEPKPWQWLSLSDYKNKKKIKKLFKDSDLKNLNLLYRFDISIYFRKNEYILENPYPTDNDNPYLDY